MWFRLLLDASSSLSPVSLLPCLNRCKTLVCNWPMWYNDSLGKLDIRPQNSSMRSRLTMPYVPQNPLIVQSDRSLLLEVDNELYDATRDELARFAELEKSPEHIH